MPRRPDRDFVLLDWGMDRTAEVLGLFEAEPSPELERALAHYRTANRLVEIHTTRAYQRRRSTETRLQQAA